MALHMLHPRLPRHHRGFTLVEVLVALFIMALMAAMSWQGIDGLVRTRDGARAHGEATLRLGTVLAQWEQDLNQVQDSAAAPAMKFDGAAMRLTRRTPNGMQFVVWTRQGEQLWRWASPPVTRVQDLQDWWIRGQQWSAISADALAMLDGVSEMQVFYFQARDNNWSNAQSTGNVDVPPPAPAASGASAPLVTFDREQLPKGVRLQLNLPTGQLTRDLVLRP
jgi:general secretion pathway protein J